MSLAPARCSTWRPGCWRRPAPRSTPCRSTTAPAGPSRGRAGHRRRLPIGCRAGPPCLSRPARWCCASCTSSRSWPAATQPGASAPSLPRRSSRATGRVRDPGASPIFESALVPLTLREVYAGADETLSPYAFSVDDDQWHAAADGDGAATRPLRPARGLAWADHRPRAAGAGGDARPAGAGPSRRAGARARAGRFAALLLAIVALLVSARALVAWAIPAGWHWSPPPPALDSAWLRSPVDWLATALLALALVALLFDLVARGASGAARSREARRATAAVVLAGAGGGWRRWWASCWSRTPRLLSGVVRASDSHGLSFGVYPLRRQAARAGRSACCAPTPPRCGWPWRCCGLRPPGGACGVAATADASRWAAVFVGAALSVAGRMGSGPLAPRLMALLPPLALVLAATGGVALDHSPLSTRLAGRAPHGGLSGPRAANRRAVSRAGQRRAGGAGAHHRRRVRARSAESPRRAARAAQPIA